MAPSGRPRPPPQLRSRSMETTKLAQAPAAITIFYNTSTNTGPELHYGGAAVVAGEFGTYTPPDRRRAEVSGGDYSTSPGMTRVPVCIRCGASTATATTCPT